MAVEDTKQALKPIIRFSGYTDAWEQRKFGSLYQRRNEKNDGSIGAEKIITVSSMLFVSDVAISSPDYLKTYNVMNVGDIAFEGHKNKDFHHGRFVENTIGNGIVSHIFDVFKPILEYSLLYWKYAINNEHTMQKTIVRSTKDGRMMCNLVASDFFSQNVSIPSLQEQRCIGQLLDEVDRVVVLHQRKLDDLNKLKKSLLQKMFPAEGEDRPAIRFSGYADAWEQRKLSDICTMHARIGWQNLRTTEFLDKGECYLITGTDFDDGKINFGTCHYVKQDRFDQDRNIQISNGSILITKDGTLGKVAFVEGLDKPATLNAGVFNVIISDKEMNGRFLFQYLKAPFLMDYVNRKATGGTIKHLNQNILVDFPVKSPKVQEQERLGTFFSEIDSSIVLHQRKLEELQKLKKSLLQKMFI